MVIYLLVLSFLLHVVSILAIVILYQRRSLERVKLPTMKEDVQTIYQSMESFVTEVEQENTALYEKISEYMKKKEIEWHDKWTISHKKIEELEEKLGQNDLRFNSQKQDSNDDFKQASDLYNQGFSDEQIAQVLKIGKGEAQFIVNMIRKHRQLADKGL